MNPTDTEMMDWMAVNHIRLYRLSTEAQRRGEPDLRAAITRAMQAERTLPPGALKAGQSVRLTAPGSYSSADRNGPPKASGPSIDPLAWSGIPEAAGAAPGGVEAEEPYDGMLAADIESTPTERDDSGAR